MAYTINEQHSRDIDWYFIDCSNSPIHVASAGGRLPNVISENDIINNQIHSAIMDFDGGMEFEINPNINNILLSNLTGKVSMTYYLKDFVNMARRGIISIDKTYLGNYDDPFYHIVAWPKKRIFIDKYTKFNVLNKLIRIDKIISTHNFEKFNLLKLFEV